MEKMLVHETYLAQSQCGLRTSETSVAAAETARARMVDCHLVLQLASSWKSVSERVGSSKEL